MIIQGAEGEDAPFLAEALREREVVHYVTSDWVETTEYPKYGLIVFVGRLEAEKDKPKTYTEQDLGRLDEWLRDGGVLLLMWSGRNVFKSTHGEVYFRRLIGQTAELELGTGDVTTLPDPEHAWVKHLVPEAPEPKQEEEEVDEAEELMEGGEAEDPLLGDEEEAEGPGALKIEADAPTVLYKEHVWLGRSAFAWILPGKGETIIGTPNGKAALYRLPVGKGTLIYLGWNISRWINPDMVTTPELDAQREIVRQIAASLPLFTRSNYLRERAAIVGKDPFVWYRSRGLEVMHDPDGWHEKRGLAPEPGPSARSEEVKSLRLDATVDEYESTFFLLSNFVESRKLKLDLIELRSEDGQTLPPKCMRLRVQQAFTVERLSKALLTVAYLRDYGPVESAEEARALACWLLAHQETGLARPLWLFDVAHAADGDAQQRVSVPRDTHLPVWLTYEPSEDVLPGLYRGELTVDADGKKVGSLPLELKLWSVRRPTGDLMSLAIVAENGSARQPGMRMAFGLPQIRRGDAHWLRYLECLTQHNCDVLSVPGGLLSLARVAGTKIPLNAALAKEPKRFQRADLPSLDLSEFDAVLKPFVELGIRSLMTSGNGFVPRDAFLAAAGRGAGNGSASPSLDTYRGLTKWFLQSWVDYVRKLGMRGHAVALMDGIDEAGDAGLAIYQRLAPPLAESGLTAGTTWHSRPTAEQVKTLAPLTDFWSFPTGAAPAFRKATNEFGVLDPQRDQVWLNVRDWDALSSERAHAKVWGAVHVLAPYRGKLGLCFDGSARENQVALGIATEHGIVACSVLEGLRDSVDSARVYRHLILNVLPKLPQDRAAELQTALEKVAGEGDEAIIRLPATDASMKDFRRAHAELLRLMVEFSPSR